MCVIAVLLDPDGGLVVAANRDEAYDRPADPPGELEPGIVGGRDRTAGGTWLGFNRRGLFVAITNRKTPSRPPEPFSRGQLALEALRCGTLKEVERLAEQRTAERPVAGFNLVAISGVEGVCLHWDSALRPLRFGPGDHVVSSDFDLDDPALPERRVFTEWRAGTSGTPSTETLVSFLSSHDGDRPICKHGDRFGTVSSTIAIRGRPLLHAEGPPCRTEFHKTPIYLTGD